MRFSARSGWEWLAAFVQVEVGLEQVQQAQWRVQPAVAGVSCELRPQFLSRSTAEE